MSLRGLCLSRWQRVVAFSGFPVRVCDLLIRHGQSLGFVEPGSPNAGPIDRGLPVSSVLST